MRRGGVIAAALLLGLVVAAEAGATEVEADLQVEGFDRADAVRRAIARELGTALDAERRPELAVAVTEDEVRVRYQEHGRPALERAIPRPARDDEVVDAIAWLAGNLARDQTSSLLASLRPQAPAPTLDPATVAMAERATSPSFRHAALRPAVVASPIDPELGPDDAAPDEAPPDPWDPRFRAISFTSTASLVNLGAHVKWGPLAAQLTAAAHPFGRAWLGGQLGAGMALSWDGPFVGVMATYAYFHAVDASDPILFDSLTPADLERALIDERHQIGLVATGGYQLTDWLAAFVGLGARVDAGQLPSDASRVTPDLSAGVLLF